MVVDQKEKKIIEEIIQHDLSEFKKNSLIIEAGFCKKRKMPQGLFFIIIFQDLAKINRIHY